MYIYTHAAKSALRLKKLRGYTKAKNKSKKKKKRRGGGRSGERRARDTYTERNSTHSCAGAPLVGGDERATELARKRAGEGAEEPRAAQPRSAQCSNCSERERAPRRARVIKCNQGTRSAPNRQHLARSRLYLRRHFRALSLSLPHPLGASSPQLQSPLVCISVRSSRPPPRHARAFGISAAESTLSLSLRGMSDALRSTFLELCCVQLSGRGGVEGGWIERGASARARAGDN